MAETIWNPVIEVWGLTVFDRERRCARLMSCIPRREIAILIYIQNLQATWTVQYSCIVSRTLSSLLAG